MSYKLHYFDARGLAEPVRMMFALADVKYEDIRIPITGNVAIPEDIKNKCNWGQVPMLEFDGKRLAQSLAITRYIAKKFKLTGADDFESACCDEYVDSAREINQAWYNVVKETDPVKQDAMKKEVGPNIENRYLVKFNEIIEANGGKWLVGKSMTWADITLAHFINQVDIITKGEVKLDAKFPAIKANREAVFSNPKIKAWVDKRPTTQF